MHETTELLYAETNLLEIKKNIDIHDYNLRIT